MGRSLLGVLGAALAVHVATALYDAGGPVIIAKDSDFAKLVLNDDGVVVVEVFAPWCGHCKSLTPEYIKAASALKGIAKVVAVDGTENQAIATKLGVKGFPTLVIYGADKKSPKPLNAREASAIVQAVVSEVQAVTSQRLAGKKPSSGGAGSKSGGGGGSGSGSKGGSGSKDGSGSGSKGGSGSPGEFGGPHITTLTSMNFPDQVLGSTEPWIVAFYAPWCGHCKSLSPEFAAAAAAVSDSGVRFGAVDATVHADLAQQFGVKGYPTIVSFKGGVKDSGAAAKGSPYNGGRTKADLVDAANALAETAGPRKGIVAQLTGGKQWAEVCGGKRICVLAVLPHILDDGAAKRLARVDVLAEAAGSISGSVRPMFTFLWSEIGAQTAVEGTLNVGMTPAVFAISEDKKIYMTYRGAFTSSAIKSWVQALATRNDGSRPLAVPPSSLVAEAEAWDGKDAKAAAGGAKEEFSLADLDL